MFTLFLFTNCLINWLPHFCEKNNLFKKYIGLKMIFIPIKWVNFNFSFYKKIFFFDKYIKKSLVSHFNMIPQILVSVTRDNNIILDFWRWKRIIFFTKTKIKNRHFIETKNISTHLKKHIYPIYYLWTFLLFSYIP